MHARGCCFRTGVRNASCSEGSWGSAASNNRPLPLKYSTHCRLFCLVRFSRTIAIEASPDVCVKIQVMGYFPATAYVSSRAFLRSPGATIAPDTPFSLPRCTFGFTAALQQYSCIFSQPAQLLEVLILTKLFENIVGTRRLPSIFYCVCEVTVYSSNLPKMETKSKLNLECYSCNAKFNSFSNFLLHTRAFHVHEESPRFVCPFASWKSNKISYGALKQHLYGQHRQARIAAQQKIVPAGLEFTCTVSMCTVNFKYPNLYENHLRSHLRAGDSISCPYPKCEKVLKNCGHFATHKFWYHRKTELAPPAPENSKRWKSESYWAKLFTIIFYGQN